MPFARATLLVLPLLALALTGCAKNYRPEPSLQLRPQVSQCPAYPLPPQELLERPRILDFLQQPSPPLKNSSETSSPPSKPSSSTP